MVRAMTYNLRSQEFKPPHLHRIDFERVFFRFFSYIKYGILYNIYCQIILSSRLCLSHFLVILIVVIECCHT